MSMNPRLVMNHLQYEFGLIPSKIVKENKGLWTIFHFGKEYADTTQKTTQKLSRKQEEILLYLKNNPKASRKDLTDNIIDLTEDGVKYNLKRLKEFGLIRRVGPDKGGFWKIIEQ